MSTQTEPSKPTTWRLVWSPEGREIARVTATTAKTAIRKAPQPYRRYLGEIYAELVPSANINHGNA